MAEAIPIRMMSPETDGARDVFHPETDIRYVLKFEAGAQEATTLPEVLEHMYPTFSTVRPDNPIGDRVWLHEQSATTTNTPWRA